MCPQGVQSELIESSKPKKVSLVKELFPHDLHRNVQISRDRADGFGLVFKSGFDQLSTDTVKVRKPTVLDMEGGDDDGGR